MGSDPDILVDLTTARTEFEAETIVQALEAQGIPAKSFATAGTMLQWDVASTQPIKVAVRRRDVERAKAALRALRADSVDIDWSELDPGEPEGADEPGPRRESTRALGYAVLLGGMVAVAAGLLLGETVLLGNAHVAVIAMGLFAIWIGLLVLGRSRPRRGG